MKILIYETWSHYIPTGYSWAKGLIELGHKVSHYDPQKIDFYDILDIDFDLIIHFDVPMYDQYKFHLDKFKNRSPETKIVGVGFPDENYYKLKPYIDGWAMNVYSFESATNKFQQMGFKSYNVGLASHPDLFYKMYLIPKYDISFIGQFGRYGHGYRGEDKYLFPILDNKNYKCKTYGFSYKNIKRETINYDKLNEVYNNSKVNLSFHYDHQKGIENDKIDFDCRVFDIALSNNFQLIDHPYITEIFKTPSTKLMLSDKKHWVEKVEYYINNLDVREQISNDIYKEAIKYHTWKYRMFDFLDNFIKGL